MKNFKVKIAYDGYAYHGFQRQDNAVTIQEVIEDALYKLFLKKIIIYGCSRTDTGVHAREYFFSFKWDESFEITPRGVIFGLNSKLPNDISVLDCEEAESDFHARYNCIGKEYEYIILNSEVRDPFLNHRAYKYWCKLDDKLLDRVAKHFVGTHDFKSFCARRSGANSTIRTIHRFDVVREGNIVKMIVSGDGFLYNMVRIMVGTLIFVNEGKISEEELVSIIEKKDRKSAGKTAPACGLYLNKVFY